MRHGRESQNLSAYQDGRRRTLQWDLQRLRRGRARCASAARNARRCRLFFPHSVEVSRTVHEIRSAPTGVSMFHASWPKPPVSERGFLQSRLSRRGVKAVPLQRLDGELLLVRDGSASALKVIVERRAFRDSHLLQNLDKILHRYDHRIRNRLRVLGCQDHHGVDFAFAQRCATCERAGNTINRITVLLHQIRRRRARRAQFPGLCLLLTRSYERTLKTIRAPRRARLQPRARI
jgi:hypothetical protein